MKQSERYNTSYAQAQINSRCCSVDGIKTFAVVDAQCQELRAFMPRLIGGDALGEGVDWSAGPSPLGAWFYYSYCTD
jgi:hypothetical protein